MRSFDLTFNGGVLPDRDPGQVRQDLARLFSIDDSALIDKIFSGETVILRHNLDRKTAADYFRKISLLGAKATLVKSPKHRAVHGDDLLILESNPEWPARETTETAPAPPIAAGSAGEQENLEQLETGDEKFEPEIAQPEDLAAEARELTRRKAASLQRQREQYERIAEEELEKLDTLSRTNCANAEKELSDLGAMTEAALQTVSSQVEKIEDQKAACRNRSEQSIARLDHLMSLAETEEEAFKHVITERLEQARRSNEENIQRLERELADAKRCAEMEINDLEQELRDSQNKSAAEKESLKKEKAEALHDCAEELRSLEERQATARARLESTSAEFGKREMDIRSRESEESRRLEAMKNDIKLRRDHGIAGVDQAMNLLRQQTLETLEQVRAPETQNLELQIQAQESKAAGSRNQ